MPTPSNCQIARSGRVLFGALSSDRGPEISQPYAAPARAVLRGPK
jgi:hypothetical protein